MNQDTPRTNTLIKRAYNLIDEGILAVPADFCRELERETVALREDGARLDRLEASMRETLGAPSAERSIACDVHMGADIRAAIDKHLPL